MISNLVLEKTLESPLDTNDTKPVNPKGNQLWIFIGGTDVGAEAPVFWPPDVKNWITGKDLDAGKDSGWEEKGEIAGDQPRLIQGIRRRDGIGEDQDTIVSIRY